MICVYFATPTQIGSVRRSCWAITMDKIAWPQDAKFGIKCRYLGKRNAQRIGSRSKVSQPFDYLPDSQPTELRCRCHLLLPLITQR